MAFIAFRKFSLILLFLFVFSMFTSEAIAADPYGRTGNWNLIFSDEFDGTSLNTSVWEPSWFQGNNISNPVNSDEDGCYDPAQISVGDGNLRLAATATSKSNCRKRDGSQAGYASGLVNTRNSFQFSYGYFEARMYLPGNNGDIWNWPAFWSNGFGPWPVTGEIDVMESLSGHQPCWHYHYQDNSGQHQGPGGCVNWSDPTGWNIYAAHWEPGKITYYYNGTQVGTITTGVVSSPHYLILNNGINDRYGINVPSTVLVDYVRVWKPSTSTASPTASPTPTATPTMSPSPTVSPPPSSSVAPTASSSPTGNVISLGSTWLYSDVGTFPGSSWNTVGFNDSTWKSGNGEFGYGDGDESTVINYGASTTNRYPAYYFRKKFNITNKSQVTQLNLGIKRDDGAVVYLNGSEVFRTNMPAGTIQHTTLASNADDDGEDVIQSTIPVSLLVNGENVIAVEVHQATVDSSDLSFDLELNAVLSATKPGDANGDGRVDGLDYLRWRNNYGRTTSAGHTEGDFNGDGIVDGLDYVRWLNNYEAL